MSHSSPWMSGMGAGSAAGASGSAASMAGLDMLLSAAARGEGAARPAPASRPMAESTSEAMGLSAALSGLKASEMQARALRGVASEATVASSVADRVSGSTATADEAGRGSVDSVVMDLSPRHSHAPGAVEPATLPPHLARPPPTTSAAPYPLPPLHAGGGGGVHGWSGLPLATSTAASAGLAHTAGNPVFHGAVAVLTPEQVASLWAMQAAGVQGVSASGGWSMHAAAAAAMAAAAAAAAGGGGGGGSGAASAASAARGGGSAPMSSAHHMGLGGDSAMMSAGPPPSMPAGWPMASSWPTAAASASAGMGGSFASSLHGSRLEDPTLAHWTMSHLPPHSTPFASLPSLSMPMPPTSAVSRSTQPWDVRSSYVRPVPGLREEARMLDRKGNIKSIGSADGASTGGMLPPAEAARRLAAIGSSTRDCPVCGRRCSSNTNLRAHFRRIHCGERYCCDRCDKTFSTAKGLNDHVEADHEDKLFLCPLCPALFRRRRSRLRHTHRIHGLKGSDVDEAFHARGRSRFAVPRADALAVNARDFPGLASGDII